MVITHFVQNSGRFKVTCRAMHDDGVAQGKADKRHNPSSPHPSDALLWWLSNEGGVVGTE